MICPVLESLQAGLSGAENGPGRSGAGDLEDAVRGVAGWDERGELSQDEAEMPEVSGRTFRHRLRAEGPDRFGLPAGRQTVDELHPVSVDTTLSKQEPRGAA